MFSEARNGDLADNSYRRDLGIGLVLRWSSAEDTAGLVTLAGTVWRSESGKSPESARIQRRLRYAHPDVTVGGVARALLPVLFPKRESWALPLG